MRRILMFTMGAALSALSLFPLTASAKSDAPPATSARAAQKTPLRFTVIPELLAKGHHGAPADGPYAVEVTLEGVNAQTKRPWATTFYATSYGFTQGAMDPKNPAQQKAPTLTLAHTANADPTDISAIAAAVTRGDALSRVTLAFHPYTGAVRATPHILALDDLKLSSLQHIRARSAGDSDKEEIGVQFRHIVWTWSEGPRMQHDEWRLPHGHVGV